MSLHEKMINDKNQISSTLTPEEDVTISLADAPSKDNMVIVIKEDEDEQAKRDARIERRISKIEDREEEVFKALTDEINDRRNLIKYLKIFLPVSTLIPLVIVTLLKILGFMGDGMEANVALLTAILTVPSGLIGVFVVISGKLFDNTYRISILKYLIQHRELTNTEEIEGVVRKKDSVHEVV